MTPDASLVSEHLNAGEILLWAGRSAGPDYSLRAVLTAAALAVGIVFVSYTLLRFFKRVKNWAEYWKNHAAISGGVAASIFFIFFPSAQIVYGLTSTRAFALNTKFTPPAVTAVLYVKENTVIKKNAGNSETLIFRNNQGGEVIFERVRLPAETRALLS